MKPVIIPPGVAHLRSFVEVGVLGPTEVHFAAWLQRAGKVNDELVLLAAALAVWAVSNGHSCVDLDRVAEVVELRLAERRDEPDADPTVDSGGLAWPEVESWIAALRSAPVDVVECGPAPGNRRAPLLLLDRRLYLQRQWDDESLVAESLRSRVGDVESSGAATALLDVLLPVTVDGRPNRQRIAADVVLRQRLAVIVGGPGTGKTYSLARVLAALLTENPGLRIALAAPTGKAAARVNESLAAALEQEQMIEHVGAAVRDRLGRLKASTVHRLLGPRGEGSGRFRHDRKSPLPYDVVVIDEVSMVALPLMARLCDALSPSTRLVLLGDPDQLESVEQGAILGDIVRSSGVDSDSAGGVLGSCTVRLDRVHRYGVDSPIARLADLVRASAEVATGDFLADRDDDPSSEVVFVETNDPTTEPALAALSLELVPYLQAVREAAESGDSVAALEAAGRLRILCAHRRGRHGVSEWNKIATRLMLDDERPPHPWFAGRIVLVLRNDDRLGLANGDTGVVVRGGEGPRVAFRRAGEVVHFEPAQLDQVDTAFAMTIHKSQGSEYPTVLMILPPEGSLLVGRELVYTGITRARSRLVVAGALDVMRKCVATSSRRMTGLEHQLR